MDVDPATAQHKSEYQGQTYYFCAPGCKRAFEAERAMIEHINTVIADVKRSHGRERGRDAGEAR